MKLSFESDLQFQQDAIKSITNIFESQALEDAINDNELILLLEKTEQKIIDSIIANKTKKVVALAKLFKDNDQLKTNTVLQMKDAGIEFKTS